ESMVAAGNALHRVDQRRELGARRKALKADAPRVRVGGNRHRRHLEHLVDLGTGAILRDVNDVKRDFLRRGIPDQLGDLAGIVTGWAAQPRWQDETGRPGLRIQREPDGTTKPGLKSLLELLACF